jgi:hypothetical protein
MSPVHASHDAGSAGYRMVSAPHQEWTWLSWKFLVGLLVLHLQGFVFGGLLLDEDTVRSYSVEF